MIISCLDVINTFSDELEVIRAEDVEVIFNFIRAFPSMQTGETWTPICVPGCTEEYMLHVYISWHPSQTNLGIVCVCTDHAAFEECHSFSQEIHHFVETNKHYAGLEKRNIYDALNTCCFQMYQQVPMAEI